MKNDTRTLVILTPAFPEDEGISSWVYSQQLMVKGLKENFPGINIVVLTFLYPRLKGAYDWNNVRVISLNGMGHRKLGRPFRWRKAWQQLNELRRTNNVMGILSFWCGECALIGSYFGKRYGIRHYCWICGQDARSTNKLVTLIRPRPDELVAMCSFLTNEFYKNHGIKPLHRVPNAIDTRQFSRPPAGERDIDIMGAGSFQALKQYPLFITTIKSLTSSIPAIKTMICGQGGEQPKLEALIKALHLEENVHLPGLVPHDELLKLMQRSKVFLHTSAYEGFSTVCLEALYAGAHVISFCDPMEGRIPNWHVVASEEEMIQKSLELLLSPDTLYKPVLINSMDDSAKAMMQLFETKHSSPATQQNISFYNEAADTYDNTMYEDRSNVYVREKVKKKFLSLVKTGWVLDFGGGTGLDLEWLTGRNYNILFCEPSTGMREKAIRYNDTVLKNGHITFLEAAKTDFTKWQEALPFTQKADAILSNFGVLNYISDTRLLFSNLARIIKPGGHFVLLILDLGIKKRMKWHRRNALQSLIFHTPFVMYIPSGKHTQTVFVHTVKEIRKAAAGYFDFCSSESLKGFDFTLIHLVRNETTHPETFNG